MKLRHIPFGVLCVLAGFGIIQPITACAAEPPPPSPTEHILTLEEALQRTLARGAGLMAAMEELHAVEAEVKLAGLLPNPELTVSLENVGGDGLYNSTDAAELTIELSQPIELGGKRRLRREAGELSRQLADNGQKLARAEELATTRQRFVAVLAAQERLLLAKEQAELAGKSLAAAEERIKAGKAPTIDRLRLQGEAGQAGLAVTQAERSLLTARQALAGSWGEVNPDFAHAEGDLSLLPAVPAAEDVAVTLEQSAAVTNRHIATQLLGVELERAKAARIPDPSLTVGWRQFQESSDNAWLFGVSFPLPLFNQGQEATAVARSRFNSAKAREISARNEARAALRNAWQTLADAKTAAEVLAGQVVPAAVAGFAAAEFGYQAGKFGLLELLDAQRNLFEVRQQQLTARSACHLAAIELQRLQGIEAAVADQ